MNGGRGNDTLIGGKGADQFKLSYGKDTISDFNPAEGDRIVIPERMQASSLELSSRQRGDDLIIKSEGNVIFTILNNTRIDSLPNQTLTFT